MATFALLALDLDGTLLTSSKKLTERSQDAIRNVADTGARIAVCTGRHLLFVRSLLDQLDLDVFVVANEGSHILRSVPHGNETLVKVSCLPELIVLSLLSFFGSSDRVVFWYTSDCVHVVSGNERTSARLQKFLELQNRSMELYTAWPAHHTLANTLRNNATSVQKIMALFDEEDDGKLLHDQMKEVLRNAGTLDNSNVVVSSGAINILPQGTHKGNGLASLCDHLKTPLSKVIAFGDENNDVEFLRSAGVGVAMRNALPQVKNVANYTLDHTNDEEGVAHEVERLLKQRSFGKP